MRLGRAGPSLGGGIPGSGRLGIKWAGLLNRAGLGHRSPFRGLWAADLLSWPWPGRVGDLIGTQLNNLGSPETLGRVNGIFSNSLDIVVVQGLPVLVLSGVARKSTDIGELSPLAVGVNVSVLATSDAIHAPGLLSERSILSFVAESE